MNGRTYGALLVLAAALVAGGCGKKQEPAAPTSGPDSVAAPRIVAPPALPDTVQLMLIRQVPLGITYRDVRVLLDGVGPVRSKGIANLTEAKAPTRIFDRTAVLDLQFSDDRLYAYFFQIENVTCPAADSLYRVLTGFYTERFGRRTEETLRESGYAAVNSFWTSERFNVVATRGKQGADCRVAWGFQNP